jgi:hypothetical protein
LQCRGNTGTTRRIYHLEPLLPGAFVERFDEFTVREHHEIYALLSALAAVRAATDRSGRIVERLESLTEVMRLSTDLSSFQGADAAHAANIDRSKMISNFMMGELRRSGVRHEPGS